MVSSAPDPARPAPRLATRSRRLAAFPLASVPIALIAVALLAHPANAAAANSPYASAVLNDNPAVYYRLNEKPAIPPMPPPPAADSSGNGHDGQYDGTVTLGGAGLVTGDASAGSVRNDNAPYQVMTQSGNTLPAGNADRTIELWFGNHDSSGTANPVNLVTYGDQGNPNGSFHIAASTTEPNSPFGHSTIEVGTPASHFTINLPTSSVLGTNLLAVTYKGSTQTATVYVDGQAVGEGQLSGVNTLVPGNGLVVGGLGEDYGEVALYGSALGPARLDAHWTAGASTHGACATTPTNPYANAVLPDKPLGFWRLNELSGDPNARVAYDSSGHCNNGSTRASSAASDLVPTDPDAGVRLEGPAEVTQSGNTLPAGNADRTIELWFGNHDSSGTANPVNLVTYGDQGNPNGSFHIAASTTEPNSPFGHSTIEVGTPASHFTINLPTSSVLGTNLLAVTYKGSTQTATVYVDGQAVGEGQLSGVNTLVPGNGLVVGGLGEDYGEVAVYGSALSPCNIVAHFEGAKASPPPCSGGGVIDGTVVSGPGSTTPEPGARVEACPSSGGSCVVDPYAADSLGRYVFVVPPGTYAVTAFPPVGSGLHQRTVGPFTVPPSASGVTIPLFNPSTAGGTLTTPQGDQSANPTVSWGDPSTYTVTGCKGGFGDLHLDGVNTSTGQLEPRAFPLDETPLGSGTYVAHLSPLAPLHGGATASQTIVCPDQSRVFPGGGGHAGGTSVLLGGSGLTGATGVTFGGAAAQSFQVLQDNLIEAVSPPGTGTVPVTITTADGQSEAVGNFSYFGVSGLDTTSGPSAGGTTVTIHGDGFTDVSGVVFGAQPAASFTVADSGTIQAVAPAGVGTVDVQVINHLAPSPADATRASFQYQNGPPGSAAIVEGSGPDALKAYVTQVGNIIPTLCPQSTLNDPTDPFYLTCHDWQWVLDHVGGVIAAGMGTQLVHDALSRLPNMIANGSLQKFITTVQRLGLANFPALEDAFGRLQATRLFVIAADALPIALEVALPGVIVGFVVWKLFIDPSGTVVDTNGNAVSGATASVLGQSAANGPVSPVDPTSGTIVPATNPETTNATGEFHWDALAGTYEVQANASGCHAPGDPSQSSVTTSPFVIPPPEVGLLLALDCPGSTPHPPSVTGLSRGAGPTAGGNEVEILGTGLAGVSAVHFGDAPATNVTVLSPYAVAATAPAGSSTVTSR